MTFRFAPAALFLAALAPFSAAALSVSGNDEAGNPVEVFYDGKIVYSDAINPSTFLGRTIKLTAEAGEPDGFAGISFAFDLGPGAPVYFLSVSVLRGEGDPEITGGVRSLFAGGAGLALTSPDPGSVVHPTDADGNLRTAGLATYITAISADEFPDGVAYITLTWDGWSGEGDMASFSLDPVSSVPLPAPALMLISGIGALGFIRGRRKAG